MDKTAREAYGEPDDEIGRHIVCGKCHLCKTCNDCQCENSINKIEAM